MLHVSPDAISWVAFAASVGAGVSFYIGGGVFLVLALLLILVNSYLDALDRYADVFMLGGVAFSAMYCQLWVGTLALLGVLLTSYMGTQAQAVGQGRQYRGILGRADRLVLLFVCGLLQLLPAARGGV